MCEEIYQGYLDRFSTQFYFTETALKESNQKKFIEYALELADIYGVEIMIIDSTPQNVGLGGLDVYTTEETAARLKSEFFLREGLSSSIISGKTQVTFHSMEDALRDGFETIYYIGDYSDISGMRNQLNTLYQLGFPKRLNKNTYFKLFPIIVVIVFVLLLLVTWYDILFQRKENFVDSILGNSLWHRILKNIVCDTVVFGVEYILFWQIFDHIFDLIFYINTIHIIFICFLLVNALLYLTLLRVNYKKSQSYADINAHSLVYCYLMKTISVIVLLLACSVQIKEISQELEITSTYKMSEKYEEYGFVYFYPITSDIPDDMSKISYMIERKCRFFAEFYDEGKVSLSSYRGDFLDVCDLVVANENTFYIDPLKKLLPADMTEKCVCFIPRIYESDDEFPYEFIEAIFPADNCITVDIIYYDDDIDMLHFDRNTRDVEYGYFKTHNPVVYYIGDVNMEALLARSKMNSMYDGDYEALDMASLASDAMYDITEEDIEEMIQDLKLKDFDYQGVMDYCYEAGYVVFRKLITNLVTVILMILLEFVLITTIVKMEFVVGAKQSAVEYVLGYSTLKRNRIMFLSNTIAIMIGIAGVVFSSLIFNYGIYYMGVVITSVLIFAFEFTVMGISMNIYGRKEVIRILKGDMISG